MKKRFMKLWIPGASREFPLVLRGEWLYRPLELQGENMTDTSLTLLKGTVDLLILAALAEGASRHGYGIAEWIEDSTGGDLLLEEGTLYPALHRLERKGLLLADWGTSENNRRAKFYRLSEKGERARNQASQDWARYAQAVSSALRPAGG